MSHDIDMSVTGGAFAAVGRGGWHDLGRVTQEQLSTIELLNLAGCNFPILRAPVLIDTVVEISPATSDMPAMTVRYQAQDERNTAIYRIHPESGEAQILGIASARYPLWTPAEIFTGFGDNVLKYLGQPVKASTAGALDGGRQVFMAFELPEDIKIAGDDTVQLWLQVNTSFDQQAITRACLTPVRAVCRNTVSAGIANALREIKFKKTANADLEAKQALAATALIPEYVAAFNRQAEELLAIDVSNQRFQKIINDLWGPGEDAAKSAVTKWEAKSEKLIELFAAAPTQEFGRGTAYAAFNAIVEHQDWMTPVGPKVAEADADAVRFARSVGITDGRAIQEPKDDMLKALLALA